MIVLIVIILFCFVFVCIGLATSFFNDKNRNLVRDLVDLIVDSKQELPPWLQSLSTEMKAPLSSRRAGKG